MQHVTKSISLNLQYSIYRIYNTFLPIIKFERVNNQFFFHSTKWDMWKSIRVSHSFYVSARQEIYFAHRLQSKFAHYFCWQWLLTTDSASCRVGKLDYRFIVKIISSILTISSPFSLKIDSFLFLITTLCFFLPIRRNWHTESKVMCGSMFKAHGFRLHSEFNDLKENPFFIIGSFMLSVLKSFSEKPVMVRIPHEKPGRFGKDKTNRQTVEWGLTFEVSTCKLAWLLFQSVLLLLRKKG